MGCRLAPGEKPETLISRSSPAWAKSNWLDGVDGSVLRLEGPAVLAPVDAVGATMVLALLNLVSVRATCSVKDHFRLPAHKETYQGWGFALIET